MTHANKLIMISTVFLLGLVVVINAITLSFIGDFNLLETFVNSGVLLLIAAAFFVADIVFKSEYPKYNTYNVLFCILMVFGVLRYYPHVGPAVWTAVFIPILLSTLRNNRRMLIMVAITTLGLGIYVWANGLSYTGGTQYYLIQFILFTIVFGIGGGVLSINQERYKKTSHYLNESEMIAQISTEMISVGPENIREKVLSLLEKTSAYYGVERAIIFLLSKDRETVCPVYDWIDPGFTETSAAVSEFNVSASPSWSSHITEKTVWIYPNVDDPSINNDSDIRVLRSKKIKAMISAPIIVKDKVYGTLVYESHSTYRDWKEEHKKLLVVITNLLGDAFTKVEAEKEINVMAWYDALTGLANRSLFHQRLDEALKIARIKKTQPAVMFIDLDSFKSVNDAVGHVGGDELLQHVGMRLKEKLGERGIVARQGGDEFVILLPDVSDAISIKELADDVMSVFFTHITVGGQEFFVTASAGIAIYPLDGEDSVALRKNADMAMYAAKEKGKNQVVFCSPKLQEDAENKIRITFLLHRALEKGELKVLYQPQIDIATSEIIGFEALLRWYSPELGLVSPGVFIPLAEQTGLIFPIGKWVLREACRQNKAWQDAGLDPVRMAVNLSVEQFRRSDIVEMVKEVLTQTGLDPTYLELEITESVASKELGYICGILEDLRQLGVSISIDDFGTEYSSLARIKRLPIDRIKMAMEFVHGIAVCEKDEAIAKVIINLANNLGLKVIAEGVETEHQYEFLKNRVCDEVQGFYFYKPMPAEEAESVLTSHQRACS